MSSASTLITVEGLDKIEEGMQSEAPKKAIADNLTRAVLQIEAKAIKATVVKTGRLRSSITHSITEDTGIIGTNVSYAPLIEFGSFNRLARHIEGSTKVLGEGMFAYTARTIGPEIKDFELKIIAQTEKECLGQ